MPALLTTTCRSPNASMAVSTIALAPSKDDTLSVLATASPPAATISSATDWAALTSLPLPSVPPPRSFTTTRAPSDAKSSACSRPIPRPAPVITATRSSSPATCILLVCRRSSAGQDRAGPDARGPVDLRVAHPRLAGDLPVTRLPAQLQDDLVDLAHARRADRLSVGEQPAVGVDRQPAADLGVAPGDHRLLLAVGAEAVLGHVHDLGA